MADTANLEELRELFHSFPLEGVTTNPTILAKGGLPLSKAVPAILEIVGNKMMHMQMHTEPAFAQANTGSVAIAPRTSWPKRRVTANVFR